MSDVATDWERIRKQPFAEGKTPDDWPTEVRQISFQGLNLLGVDRSGQLYWDGKRLQTVARLNWYERVLATIAALGTGSVALFDAIRFFDGA